MQRAGAAAAGEIALRCRDRLDTGILVFAGPGNNGGDAWVVARALAAAGVGVRVTSPLATRTPDANAERALALPFVEEAGWADGAVDTIWKGERVVIDGLLGTGSTGAPRGAISDAVRAVGRARERGAIAVALDLPSGVDATTGDATGAVAADLTLTFGTLKRGHLVAREACGAIAVLDIGLGTHAQLADDAPSLVDERWVAAHVPLIGAASHKGARKKLAILGGARGMAGACVLAGRAAMASGIGMVKLIVEEPSLGVVQESEPYALAARWPADGDSVEREITRWADAVIVGPGLGQSSGALALVERVLSAWHGPVVLDADALNVFAGNLDALARALRGDARAALLTPHVAELARLVGIETGDVLSRRFEVGGELARRIDGSVLLKGVPTVISAPSGATLVSGSGTPVLAVAGSGDVLSGVAGTLLAQLDDALVAGAAGAWVHGRAAERAGTADATAPARVRGITLGDVLAALPSAWAFDTRPPRYPVLAQLSTVGERA